MKRILGQGVALAAIVGLAMGILANASAQAADYTEAQYQLLEKCEWKSPTDGTLLYRFFKPEVKEGEKYPLIIFLHGAGERGADNQKQLFQDHFLHFLFSEEGKKHPSFLIAPQCPEGKRWCEVNWSEPNSHTTPEQPSEYFRMLRELLASLKKDYPIDEKRIYITGVSMGGFGTFDYLVRYPEDIAAAIPVCGGADNARLVSVPEVRNVATWIFHGSDDSAVNPERSRKAFATLKEINPNVHYTEFPGVQHASWVPAYRSEEMIKWVFEQKKK